jgi:hypothetical protein
MRSKPLRVFLAGASGAIGDRDGLHDAIGAFEPDLVLHELTDMPDGRAQVPEWAATTRRMYREGTPNLIAAAVSAGVGRLAAQSVAWRLPGENGKAVAEHERAVLSIGGVVIRYGRFFGPGTYFETEPPPPPRIHIDAAARETIPALDQAGGVVVVSER